jgi:hypothetical protein
VETSAAQIEVVGTALLATTLLSHGKHWLPSISSDDIFMHACEAKEIELEAEEDDDAQVHD